jgi:hypothetical protein
MGPTLSFPVEPENTVSPDGIALKIAGNFFLVYSIKMNRNWNRQTPESSHMVPGHMMDSTAPHALQWK